jgi:hypothetical protein
VKFLAITLITHLPDPLTGASRPFPGKGPAHA